MHTWASGISAWSHIENFLCAHPCPVKLKTVVDPFLHDLTTVGIGMNPADTQLTPTCIIPLLGFALDSSAELISQFPS